MAFNSLKKKQKSTSRIFDANIICERGYIVASYHILMLADWLQFTVTPSRHERHTKTEVTPQTRVLGYLQKYFQRKLEH